MKTPCISLPHALLVFLVSILSLSCEAQKKTEWSLIWSDEFNYEGLPDSTKWTNEVGFIRGNEEQYYTSKRLKNNRVEDGVLIIEAHKESYKNPDYVTGSSYFNDQKRYADYTSACVHTKNTFDFQYGRIEVKAKLPKGRGTHPAIWTLGSNIDDVPWPLCGEIDILESVGYDPGIVHAYIHTEKYNHTKGISKGDSLALPTLYDEFNIYAVNWYPDSLEFYVNDKKHYVFHNEQEGVASWPFDKPQYLLLNLAIGGGWGGRKGIDDAIFPQKYFIDYVRIYQKK